MESDFRRQLVEIAARKKVSDARNDNWAENVELPLQAIQSAILSYDEEKPDIRKPHYGLVVAQIGRTGPATSLKVQNIKREPYRVIQVFTLLTLAALTLDVTSDPLRALSAVVAFGFAAFTATRVSLSYSDAVVLDKAWRLALERKVRHFTKDDILAVRHEIVRDYRAPKCASENEILDALENLRGLKAIQLTGELFILAERIVFFKSGRIQNAVNGDD